jgi:hypothetical protein
VPAKWVIRKIAERLVGMTIPTSTPAAGLPRDVSLPYLRLLPPGFSCVTTLTLSFLHNQHDVRYVPITYAKRAGSSKFHFTKDAYRYLLQVLRMVMYFNPLKVLMPLALWLIGSGCSSWATTSSPTRSGSRLDGAAVHHRLQIAVLALLSTSSSLAQRRVIVHAVTAKVLSRWVERACSPQVVTPADRITVHGHPSRRPTARLGRRGRRRARDGHLLLPARQAQAHRRDGGTSPAGEPGAGSGGSAGAHQGRGHLQGGVRPQARPDMPRANKLITHPDLAATIHHWTRLPPLI